MRNTLQRSLEAELRSASAIPSDNALGVAMRDIKALKERRAPNHELAAALWDSGI